MTAYVQLQLTCSDATEADRIARVLLKQRLIVSAKQVPVTSQYWQGGRVTHNEEVLLLMETASQLFGQIDDAVAQLHGDDRFKMLATPIAELTDASAKWLDENLWQEGLRKL